MGYFKEMTMPRVAILAAVVLAFSTGECLAVSKAVKEGCSSDYASYCSQHKVGTQALKSCMRSHRHTLSEGCIKALGNSTEVTAEDIRQYKREHRK
jgi:hypothetical protein